MEEAFNTLGIRIKPPETFMQEISAFMKEFHPKGFCLSTYVSCYEKMKWKCEFEHVWETIWAVIRGGHWCPYCAKKAIPTLEDINDFLQKAHPHSMCLSDCYIDSSTKMPWKCEFGHVWSACWNNIKSGTWCPICHQAELPSMEEIHEFIQKNHPDGKCLSTSIINRSAKMVWQCKAEHIWESPWKNIEKGTWCSICNGKIKASLPIINLFLNEKHPGGKCLDDIYINNKTVMKWECEKNHVWEAAWFSIHIDKSWCPTCNTCSGFGERCCIYAFSTLFNNPFYKIRPVWLKNPKTGHYLELDGYCPALNLAFEYQGLQHITVVSLFKGTLETIEQQQYRDEIKRQICKKLNIFLMEIPQFTKKFRPKHLKAFIKNKCLESNIPIPTNYDSIELNFDTIKKG